MSRQEPKYRRQRLIAELVASEVIATQAELHERLAERGVQVTQVTISRDVHVLRLVRLPLAGGTRGRHRYRLGRPMAEEDVEDELKQRFGLFVRTIERGEHVLIVKTDDGHAAGIARYLDKLGLTEIVGTVAGQDAIVVVARSSEAAAGVLSYCQTLLTLAREAKGGPVPGA